MKKLALSLALLFSLPAAAVRLSVSNDGKPAQYRNGDVTVTVVAQEGESEEQVAVTVVVTQGEQEVLNESQVVALGDTVAVSYEGATEPVEVVVDKCDFCGGQSTAAQEEPAQEEPAQDVQAQNEEDEQDDSKCGCNAGKPQVKPQQQAPVVQQTQQASANNVAKAGKFVSAKRR